MSTAGHGGPLPTASAPARAQGVAPAGSAARHCVPNPLPVDSRPRRTDGSATSSLPPAQVIAPREQDPLPGLLPLSTQPRAQHTAGAPYTAAETQVGSSGCREVVGALSSNSPLALGGEGVLVKNQLEHFPLCGTHHSLILF